MGLGVIVSVGLGVALAVALGVAVLVGVSVRVGDGVGVAVGEGAKLRCQNTPPPKPSESTTTPRRVNSIQRRMALILTACHQTGKRTMVTASGSISGISLRTWGSALK
ncbi:MAG: hypothetical protein P8X64_00550 [Anaerolineales bacterium]